MIAEVIEPDTTLTIEGFVYPPVPERPGPVWDGLSLREVAAADQSAYPSCRPGSSISAKPAASPALAEWEEQLQVECARSYEAGRDRGREEASAAAREQFELALEGRRGEGVRQVSSLFANFAREQARYFEEIEPEIVRLALAIAARILRREAQTDPLLLTGAVRVALGQISASARVRLLVPPCELELWTEAMALLPNLPVKPAVASGEGMAAGDCRLESDLGSVDLGIAAQLVEIERHLFDRARGGLPAEDTTGEPL